MAPLSGYGMIVHGDLSINDTVEEGTERSVFASGARYRVTVTLDTGNYIYRNVSVGVDKAEGFHVEEGSNYYELWQGQIFYRKWIWQTPVLAPGTVCTITLSGQRIKKGPGGGGVAVWKDFSTKRESELLSPIISIYKPAYSTKIALAGGGSATIYFKAVADDGNIIEHAVPVAFDVIDPAPTNKGTGHGFTSNPASTNPATGCGQTGFHASTMGGDDYRVFAWYEKDTKPTSPDTSQQSGYLFVVSIVVDAETEEDEVRTHEIQVQLVNTATFVWYAKTFEIVYDLLPSSGWTADKVTLRIFDSSNTLVHSKTLSTSPGNNKNTTWNGKDDDTGELVEYGHNYKVKFKVKKSNPDDVAEDLEIESSAYNFTVYQVNQGNTVYYDLDVPIVDNEHAGVVYAYVGNNKIQEIGSTAKYLICEVLGPRRTVAVSRTLQEFIEYAATRMKPYHGTHTSQELPSDISAERQERAQIIQNANAQLGITYVLPSELLEVVIPKGVFWDYAIEDILRIRCDGVTEVAYENAANRLFGDAIRWNIMISRSYFAYHNAECTPANQMAASAASVLYLPYP